MADKMIQEAQMMFSSALTTKPHLVDGVEELIAQIAGQMAGEVIDFAQLFITPHFRAMADEIVERLQIALQPRVLLGCTGESVISREHEVEQRPGMAFIAARLPKVTVTPFKLQSMNWDAILHQAPTFQRVIEAPDDTRLFVMLADPFTTPMDRVLEAFNNFYPEIPLIGGMASGSHRPGGNALLFNDQLLNNGVIGVAFAGAVEVDVIVSQGCRPIGEPMRVTDIHENVIIALENRNPLLCLQNLVKALDEQDQALLQQGLFIGRAVNPRQEGLGRGDFLIRSVIGIDRENGALVVGDYINRGEMIQFHVRDAVTAKEDLEMMLTPQMLYEAPAGALLFSCNGRGTRLYDHPDGDISAIQNVVGQVDLAGFFCAGEIGPIGGKNFLHGHTASMALFRPLESA